MMEQRNLQTPGENGRPLMINTIYSEGQQDLPVILFCHGFKGFKDWGAWNLMGSAFAKAGYLYISFNYSHNGGTATEPIDFPDLEAFGNNNYSIEVRDTQRMLDWIEKSDLPADLNRIVLLGHSRAGGITTLVAAEDDRLSALITMASVADYGERFPEDIAQWKKDGVYYIKNGRTNQQMPLYYQFYEDWLANKDELDILKAAGQISIPHFIIHGTEDPTVQASDAHRLHKASPNSELRLVAGADHVFGASHPWENDYLPGDLGQVVQCTVNWLDKNLNK